MKPIEIALDIDFKQLREQKAELIKSLPKNSILWGIVHVIDEIQDQAVEKHGFKEKDIFG